MKILYILDQKIEEGKTSGIIHKIRDKIQFWSKAGHDIEVLSLYDFRRYDSKLNLIDESKAFNIKSHGRYFTLFRLFFSTLKLFMFLPRKTYDLIYMRQRPYMPMTKLSLKGKSVVVEINTDDVGEYGAISKLMSLYNNTTRALFYDCANAFVSVTEELSNKYKDEFNKKTITIANGISVEDYPFIKETKSNRPQVCFIGSPGFPWHGLDKVFKIASQLEGIDFKIIGIEGEDYENLKFYGYLPLDKAKEVVAHCDVGICSLSLHLNAMNEASPLKSRQYLAHGLPIIYAYDDTDLNGDEQFALKLPNTLDNIAENLDKIKEFIIKCHRNSDLRKEARGFARDNLDIKTKELKRIKFLKELVASAF